MGIPEQFMVDGNLYSLPFRSDFWVVFYNKDAFDEAGVAYPTNNMTMNQWFDIIRQVRHGEGTDIVWGNHFHNWASTTTLFGILDGQHTIADGNYEWLIPIYEAVLALEDGGYVPRRTDLAAGSIHHRNTWLPGQTAQVNMGTWFFADALNSEFNWGIASYPVPSAQYAGNTLGQVTQLAIPRSAANPQEAMNFIAFVSGAEGAEILASVGQLPAWMTDAALDLIFATPGFPQDETSRAAMRPNNIFLEMPMHELAAEINAIRNEVHTEIMDRTMTVEQGIEMMNQRIGRDLLGQ
jgi:multiple sugar transport system substrate-binding protein